MRKKIRTLLIMAAIGISLFLFVEKVEAAGNEPLIKIEKLKMTQVSDRRFATLKKSANVSGKQAFIQEFAENAKQRKSTFSITCSSWDDVEPDVYDYLDSIDDKKTSDDADFLKGGILELGWSGYINSSGEAVVNCKLVYTENASQVKKVNSKSKAILKKLKVNGMSDVAKVKVIHDYVVGLVTYDNSLKDHSAYGGLAASKHSTVCQGYALIMYKLLTDAGVPCHYVTGDAGGPHAWNIVKIKGKWYYLDATWDDPSDTTVYDYFLIGSNQLKKDHKTDKYYTNKYKMASSNLNWKSLIKKSKKKDDIKAKTGQTKKEIKAGQAAMARAEVIQMLNETLDETLNEDPNADEYVIQMYDLCKKIYGFIIEDMSEEAFTAFLEREDMMEVYTDGTLELISEYILNPMIEYMDSDEFMDELVSAMYSDFGKEEFDGLTDEDLESILDAYAYESFTTLLYAQSEAYTDGIVKSIVDALESML